MKNFIKQKKFNSKQIRWILKLTIYDFEIFYHSNKINLIDESFKRLNYEKVSSLNIKLLFTLQNKFALSTKKQIDFENLNFVSNIATNIQLIEKDNARAKNRREMLKNFNSLFQIIEI